MKNKSFKKLFDLSGKNAIVTGALGILSRRFCAGLAECGANLVVTDLDEKAARKYASDLSRQYKIDAIGIGCDVSLPADVRHMTALAVRHFKEINILLNNAASMTTDLKSYFAPFEKYSLDVWRKVMSVNIDGMFLVAQALGQQMLKQRKGGSIIQTSSIYGSMAPDQRIYKGSFYLGGKINTPAVYSASKGAVVALTKYLATYWADHNIRVNTLTPGGVESGQNNVFKKKYSDRIPLGRMARADEIVGALIYLARMLRHT